MNSPKIQTILTHGDYELRGQFMLGSNYTFLVDVHHEGETVKAVYKPSKGEQPLWDFPDNTLALREVAAYELSEALSLTIVTGKGMPFHKFIKNGSVSDVGNIKC